MANSEGIELNTVYVFPSNLATFEKIKEASMTVRLKVVNSSQLTRKKREILCKRERKKNQSKSNKV